MSVHKVPLRERCHSFDKLRFLRWSLEIKLNQPVSAMTPDPLKEVKASLVTHTHL